MNFLRVAPLINDCPNCKNGVVGNGEGTISVGDNFIKRTCKCGFIFEYDIRKGTSKTEIKKAINKALKSM